jgi:hypothetical protein
MKVLGVAIPGPHLGKPVAISSGLAAQRFLDRGIDEDAGDHGILRSGADELGMGMGPHFGSTSNRSGATTSVAELNSRSSRLCTWSGIGVNQISTSRPTWWLVWPESIGPPRGCDMSPTRRPFQPTFFAFLANRSMKRTRCGLERNVYICPGGKLLHTTGTVIDGGTLRYRASKVDCDVCAFKMRCCPSTPMRYVPRDLHEDARDVARALAKTEAYEQSRRERKKVEMRFAHMKRIFKLDRLRLRGLSGAKDEVLLTATAQNLRRLVKFLCRPPPSAAVTCAT